MLFKKKLNSLCCMALLCLCASSCYTLRGLKWRQPDLDDVNKFKSVTIPASTKPFTFLYNTQSPRYANLKRRLDTLLLNSNTNAFVVIKHDTIVYEYYNTNQSASSLHTSFSVAKSFIGTLIGIAVDKQLIKSTSEPVVNYLPQLSKNDKRLKMLTIQQVLDMRACIDFDEHQETMFGSITRLYYGRSLNNQVNRLRLKANPGVKFEYQSICTQLLSAILEHASGKKVEVLLRDWLWQPLGMESDAIWSTDDQHTIKASCCLNATALDFAKLGRLYLHKGEWQGREILSKNWATATTHPDTLMQKGYKNQWWGVTKYNFFKDSVQAVNYKQQQKLDSKIGKNRQQMYYIQVPSSEFEAIGILQQAIYVNTDNGVIIVRLGDEPPAGKANFPYVFNINIGRQF